MLRLGKSEELFQEFYRGHYGRIRRTLVAMTGNVPIAEELTQEAFMKAWKGLPHFGFRSSLSTWIFQVAINVGRDWYRSGNHKIRTDAPEFLYEMVSPEHRAIQDSLLKLDDETRALLILHYYEGMTIEEIAPILEVPSGTVKSRLHTAKSKLKEMLVEQGFNV